MRLRNVRSARLFIVALAAPHWSAGRDSALPLPWSGSRYAEDEFANSISVWRDHLIL
jgi:hypothetical protein